MADFNTMTSTQIIAEMNDYGFTYIDDHSGSMYFQDTFRVIIKLTIDTICHVESYVTEDDTHWKRQYMILTSSTVTDLNSLDVLLVAQYYKIDPVIFKSESLLNLTGFTVLTYDHRNYFQSHIFLDTSSNEIKVSSKPSSYRNREVNWVPVVLLNGDWFLKYNDSFQVPTANVVQDVIYGDFIIVIKNT